jgi:hypothetical protein
MMLIEVPRRFNIPREIATPGWNRKMYIEGKKE